MVDVGHKINPFDSTEFFKAAFKSVCNKPDGIPEAGNKSEIKDKNNGTSCATKEMTLQAIWDNLSSMNAVIVLTPGGPNNLPPRLSNSASKEACRINGVVADEKHIFFTFTVSE
jgi:hypothetical protein